VALVGLRHEYRTLLACSYVQNLVQRFALLFLALVLYPRMLLHIVEKTIIVGHLLLRGIMKIKGLQGTMIDGEAMVTGEVLTLIFCDHRRDDCTPRNQPDGMRDMLLPGAAAQCHPTTLRDFQTRVQHDFAGPGPYPPMVLPQYDNFAAPCERGHRFASLVLVSAPSWSGSSTLTPQLLRNPQTRVQQPDGTRDVLLPGVAAQRRSHENSRPATRWNERCAPSWSGSSTSIPRKLSSSNQMEREMCS
jgi:hypothetical protein